MRPLVGEPFDTWRDRGVAVIERYGTHGDETCGCFTIPASILTFPRALRVIASQGGGWDHVSVSLAGSSKPPAWAHMVGVKRLVFLDHEWAIEYHPPPGKNISVHDGCLHLWRPNDGAVIPTPPSIMVGVT